MTNTNPLTDRLQREARERLIPLLNEHGMGIYTGRPELFDLQAEIIAHTFKETLTAAMKALPEERIIHGYMPCQNTPENNAWNEYRLATIKALTTLTSSNITQV